MLQQSPPRYIINPPALTGSKWFPIGIVGSVTQYQNPNYLNSVWLGAWLPVQVMFGAPARCIVHTFNFRFKKAMWSALSIPILLVHFAAIGLMGRLRVLKVPHDVLIDSVVLSHGDQAQLSPEVAMLGVIDTEMIG